VIERPGHLMQHSITQLLGQIALTNSPYFSPPIPIIGGPKRSIQIKNGPFFVVVVLFVIMTITTILNEHLFELNIIHQ
jgi:hypothetical protein